MNTIIRRVLAFILSFALIFSSTSALAASPSGWTVSPADIIINGISATVTAIKGAGSSALQSTVQHAPTVGNIGKKIIKIGGGAAAVYAITELLGAGVDWVLDPANNRVVYKEKTAAPDSLGFYYSSRSVKKYVSDPVSHCISYGGVPDWNTSGNLPNRPALACRPKSLVGVDRWYYQDGAFVIVDKYLPISTVAAKVQSNAAAGHAPSQELIKTVIIDDVNAGVLDTPLNTNAVPKADAPPVTDPNNPPWTPDQPVPPFDPSSIIAAIKSVMAAVVNMSGILSAKIDALMIDLGLKQAETIEAITAGTGEIVAANDRTGAKVAEMVAAIEAIEGNTLDGQVINDAIDRVIANDNAKVGDIIAAIEAIEGNTLDGQVINDAIDRVIANDNANAQAAADAAEVAEAARAADAKAAADAAEAAEVARAADAKAAKEAADAKAAADAEFRDWVKEKPPALDNDTELDIPMPDVVPVDTDINFGGSCPANFEFNGSIFGNPINIVLLDTSKFCGFLSTFVKFPVYAASSLFALYILGGRKDV